MICKLCNSPDVEIIHSGPIRTGKPGNLLPENVDVYRCGNCGVIFHNYQKDKAYYETGEYREIYEGTNDIENFYRLHDGETLNKLKITGTDIFRNKIVADIGCGGGGFLDFLSGVAKEIVAVEPSAPYRKEMSKKGYRTFAYAKDAIPFYNNKIDVITSFDVIEHVEDPAEFLRDIHSLIADNASGGRFAIIATPTEMPLLRKFAGKAFDQGYLFNTEHLWIFNRQSLEFAAVKAGFKNTRISYMQRYGFGNFISWLKTGEAKGNAVYEDLPPMLSAVFNASLEENNLADYIVAYLSK